MDIMFIEVSNAAESLFHMQVSYIKQIINLKHRLTKICMTRHSWLQNLVERKVTSMNYLEIIFFFTIWKEISLCQVSFYSICDWLFEFYFLQKCVQNPKTKGMPLSSFLLKPMQRITKYPLLVEKVKLCLIFVQLCFGA